MAQRRDEAQKVFRFNFHWEFSLFQEWKASTQWIIKAWIIFLLSSGAGWGGGLGVYARIGCSGFVDEFLTREFLDGNTVRAERALMKSKGNYFRFTTTPSTTSHNWVQKSGGYCCLLKTKCESWNWVEFPSLICALLKFGASLRSTPIYDAINFFIIHTGTYKEAGKRESSTAFVFSSHPLRDPLEFVRCYAIASLSISNQNANYLD